MPEGLKEPSEAFAILIPPIDWTESEQFREQGKSAVAKLSVVYQNSSIPQSVSLSEPRPHKSLRQLASNISNLAGHVQHIAANGSIDYSSNY